MSSVKGQKGFTLIEIVMVIILLGILAAVAIPRFVNLSDDARQAAIDGAFGALNSQLSIAIAKNKKIPTLADFETEVHDIVESSLTGELNFVGWAITGTTNADFVLRSGTTTAGGGGWKATVTYRKAPTLKLGTKASY